MAKVSKAKQRFEQRKQHNQIVAQLQGLKDQGFTADQIRNAGNNAYKTLSQQTPAATTAPTYTAAPAWAQSIAQSAYNPTPGAFNDAITGMTQSLQANAPQQPLQWWQRGQPGAPKKNPFGNVTGTAGLGSNQPAPTASGPMYVPGGLSPSQQQAARQAAKQASPYVPQWLGGSSVYVPGGLSQTQRNAMGGTNQFGGAGNTPYGPAAPAGYQAPPNPTPAGGTVGNRRPNPLTGIPDFPMLSSLESYSGGGGYYPWKKRRRRGGGGGRFYQPRGGGEGYGKQPYVPSIGQASWNIG